MAKVFIYGAGSNEAPAPSSQEETRPLNMSSGDQIITPTDSSKLMSKVTVKKPDTLVEDNIKIGVNIGGVIGTYDGASNPLTASSDNEMAALLVNENVGKVAKFTGTSTTYKTNEYYLICRDTYTVTYILDNVTGNSNNPTVVESDTAYTTAFTANTGYSLPDNVRIEGAEGYLWNKNTGVFMIRNATSNVTIYIAGVSDTAETWVFSDNISLSSTYSTAEWFNKGFITNNVRRNMIGAAYNNATSSSITYANRYGNTETTDEIFAYEDSVWADNSYKTITFDSPATGDLLTFLQTYATKSGGGYILTVSRSSYGNSGDNGYVTLLINNSKSYSFDEYTEGDIIQNVKTVKATAWSNDDGNAAPVLNGVSMTLNTEYKLTSDSEIVYYAIPCFVEGTLITLGDGTTKAVEDIDYDDLLLTWDFDESQFGYRKPCWIAKEGISPCYWNIKLSDGTVLKLVGAKGKSHRLFNATKGKFIYPQDFDKDDVTDKGRTIVSCEKVYETVKYYNIMTEHDINCYANGVLTGNRFCNIYPIEDMRYIKDNRKRISREEYAEIPDKLFYGLRLAEQPIQDDKPDNVNYYHTMKEHILHNIVEHEKNYRGNMEEKQNDLHIRR